MRVTTPKLLLPPLRADQRVGLVFAFATTTLPDARTTLACEQNYTKIYSAYISYLKFGNGIADKAIAWREEGHPTSSCEATNPNRGNTATGYTESKRVELHIDINPPISWSD